MESNEKLTTLLSVADVAKMLGVGKTTFYIICKLPSFPRPIILSKRKQWVRSEILGWMESRRMPLMGRLITFGN